jgi:hypothetical protein
MDIGASRPRVRAVKPRSGRAPRDCASIRPQSSLSGQLSPLANQAGGGPSGLKRSRSARRGEELGQAGRSSVPPPMATTR